MNYAENNSFAPKNVNRFAVSMLGCLWLTRNESKPSHPFIERENMEIMPLLVILCGAAVWILFVRIKQAQERIDELTIRLSDLEREAFSRTACSRM